MSIAPRSVSWYSYINIAQKMSPGGAGRKMEADRVLSGLMQALLARVRACAGMARETQGRPAGNGGPLPREELEELSAPEIPPREAFAQAERLEAAALERAEEGFSPFAHVCAAFDLDGFARHALLLSCAAEVDARLARALAFLQDDEGGDAPTLRLALRLYGALGEEAEGLLARLQRRADTLHLLFSRGGPFACGALSLHAPLTVHPRVLRFLRGQAQEEPGEALVVVEDAPEPIIGEEDGPGLADFLSARAQTDETTIVCLHGPEGAGRRLRARTACGALGQLLVEADAARLFQLPEPADEALRACLLYPAALALTAAEAALAEDGVPDARLLALIARLRPYARVLFLISERPLRGSLPQGCARLNVCVEPPTPMQRLLLWEAFLRPARHAPLDVAALANKYAFTPGQMRQAVADAQARALWQGHKRIDEQTLTSACRDQIAHGLGKKATLVRAVYGFDDLVLPPPQKRVLRMAMDQVKYRHIVYEGWGFRGKTPYGRGLSMLFSGPPGTGKTMAAQVIARELQLELYKVDLSAVVSKYVGETEQNLSEVFAQVARSSSILFFDEADALFGKRTEVKDAHDRYANVESSYLLQKIEEFEGIVILATNFLQNFDDAFRRRIKFVVDFPFPDERYRLLIWQGVFPPGAPLAPDLDLAYLAATFELSGSNIRNVALGAAFLAAQQGAAIGMVHALQALRQEMHKAGKVVLREDFGEHFAALDP